MLKVVEGSADHLHQIPYLCSFSLLSDDLLETRTHQYNQVLQLRGRLELLTRPGPLVRLNRNRGS